MKYRKYRDRGAKLILATALVGTQALSAPGILQDIPIILGQYVQPNILMLIDDSGSMNHEVLMTDAAKEIHGGSMNGGLLEFSPTQFTPAIESRIRALCSGHNTLAYDPSETYEPWLGVDVNGDAYDNKTITTAMDNPYDISITRKDFFDVRPDPGLRDLSDHFYIEWADDGDEVYQDGECFFPSYPVSGLTGENCKSQTSTCKVVAELSAEEQQNYANWFTYFRNREFVMKKGLSELITNNYSRVGIASLHGSNDAGALISDIDDSTGDPVAIANKENLLDNLFRFQSDNDTPARIALYNAGLYFDEDGDPGEDFFNQAVVHSTAETISTKSPILNAANGGICQQNFTVLFSDGFWNGSFDAGLIGNADGDNSSAYDSDAGNFSDDYSDTLADIAMHYYENDLAPSLANILSLADPHQDGVTVSHQNMSTYTVAFGVSGSLPQSEQPTNADFVGWPEPQAGQSTAVDDMRHAAWNGRGQFLNAGNPKELIEAFEQAIADIEARAPSTAVSVSFNSGRISTDTLLFLSEFNTDNWWGDLQAYRFDDDGIVVDDDGEPEVLWSASDIAKEELEESDGWKNRKIFTYNGLSGIAFEFPENYRALLSDADAASAGELADSQIIDLLEGAPANYLATDTGDIAENQSYGEAIVDYFKGDSSNEFVDGEGLFRARDGKYLGAFVYSSPQYFGEPSEPYPDLIEGSGNEYSTFVNTLTDNPRTPIVYIGGNGGMLHAFNGSSEGEGGKEVFAYIPGIIENDLHALAESDYAHQAYVDGTPTIRDVFVDGSWRSYLVGTMRSGGKGVYVLDVTDPDLFNEDDIATVVKQEFTDDDLGFTFSRPQIVKLNHDGRWAAIFGNGYNADGDGTASLYILYLDDGSFVKLETHSGSIVNASCVDPDSDCNGLSSPSVVDLNGDFIVDRVYAGDLHGNLWAFDLSSEFPGSWSTTKLFTASTAADCTPTRDNGCRQPITTQPEVAAHPARRGSVTSPNILVYFGTGQSIAQGDDATQDLQSFYGIWDASAANAAYAGLTKADLQVQEFTASLGVTNNPVSYIAAAAGSGGNFGWYYDLQVPTDNVFLGGRVSSNPLLLGEIIFFLVTIPNQSSLCTPEDDEDDGVVNSYLIALEAYNGTESEFAVFGVESGGIAGHANPVNAQTEVIVGIDAIEDKLIKTSAEGDVISQDVITRGYIPQGRKSWSIIK